MAEPAASPPSLLSRRSPAPAPPPSRLTGSLDLISLFNLSPLYDQFLRPYLPDSTTLSTTASAPGSPKGKEKATDDPTADAKPTPPPNGAAPAAGLGRLSLSLGGVKLANAADGANGVGGKGKKVKMDKTYSHLVADIPGKPDGCVLSGGVVASRRLRRRFQEVDPVFAHFTGRNNIKKDHHLFHLAMNPDIQPAHIQPFDPSTLRDAFSLVPGTIPGFDNLIWTNEGDTGKKKVSLPLSRKCVAVVPPADWTFYCGEQKKKKRPLDDGDATGSGTDGGADGGKKKKRKGEGGGGTTP